MGKPLSISRGELSCNFDGGELRGIFLDGAELLRGANLSIRDENWGTYGADGSREAVVEIDGCPAYVHEFSAVSGMLACRFEVMLLSERQVRITGEITSRHEVQTNRAGLTLLHPIKNVGGEALKVTAPDGGVVDGHFPALISPSQVAADIAQMDTSIGAHDLCFKFAGEVFEMEDQRNWTDGSFKTYCRPLGLPRPYAIAADETVRQSVELSISPRQSAPVAFAESEDRGGARRVPQMAIALEGPDLSGVDADLLAKLAPATLTWRLDANDARAASEVSALLAATKADLDLEIIVDPAFKAASQLDQIASALAANQLAPSHVICVSEPYMDSHQPEGPWPEGPTLIDLYPVVRNAFPSAKVGGGVLTNFTEMNRCPPAPSACDYITHGTTAIVHAADDRLVLQTIEALPVVMASAQALGNGKPYRLGLVAIGMRTNPYGASVFDNPDGIRLPMARDDPRQRGVFGAGFALAALCAASRAGVQSFTPAMAQGGLGFGDGNGGVWPLYHMIRAMKSFAGCEIVCPDPGEEFSYVMEGKCEGETLVVAANLGAEPLTIDLPSTCEVCVLDQETEAQASRPDWLNEAKTTQTIKMVLMPMSCGFARNGGHWK